MNKPDWWNEYVCPVCNQPGYPSMTPRSHERHPGGCCTNCGNQYVTVRTERVSETDWWNPKTWGKYRIETHLANGEILIKRPGEEKHLMISG